MSKRTVQTLILLVDNEFGVLTRVTALVRREGWNIKSLAVAETMNTAVSRLTISVECLDSTLPTVLQRIGKLACVRAISCHSAATHISRELVLIAVGEQGRAAAEAAAAAFGANAEEFPGGGVLIEFAGLPSRADELIAALEPFGIQNIARSGVVTLEKPVMEEV